jgi:hypothetical protein
VAIRKYLEDLAPTGRGGAGADLGSRTGQKKVDVAVPATIVEGTLCCCGAMCSTHKSVNTIQPPAESPNYCVLATLEQHTPI